MIPTTALLWALTALAGGQILIGVGAVLVARSRQATPQPQPEAPPVEAAPAIDIDALVARVAERIEETIEDTQASIAATQEAIRVDLAALRADMEWLTSERMIEQAIALARSGEAPEAIAEATGLSAEDARTLASLRRH